MRKCWDLNIFSFSSRSVDTDGAVIDKEGGRRREGKKTPLKVLMQPSPTAVKQGATVQNAL